MNDLVSVEEVDCKKDLLDGLGGIFLSELSLLADTIKELSTGSKLRDNVKLVLEDGLVSFLT